MDPVRSSAVWAGSQWFHAHGCLGIGVTGSSVNIIQQARPGSLFIWWYTSWDQQNDKSQCLSSFQTSSSSCSLIPIGQSQLYGQLIRARVQLLVGECEKSCFKDIGEGGKFVTAFFSTFCYVYLQTHKRKFENLKKKNLFNDYTHTHHPTSSTHVWLNLLYHISLIYSSSHCF